MAPGSSSLIFNTSIYGPNGFVREFTGSYDPTAALCQLKPEPYDVTAGLLVFSLTAGPAAPCSFTVTPLAYLPAVPQVYQVAPNAAQVVTIPVNASGNWYDVAVATSTASWHLMGRIERPGCTSDPAMADSANVLAFHNSDPHPTVPHWVRKTRDPHTGTHKDNRCFEAEHEPFYESLCAADIAFHRAQLP
jgi:hypothetical protein